jgi:transcriptional regulator with XRE-family HTH domain
LVVKRGKGIELSMIFNRCTIHFYLFYLQEDADRDLAMVQGLSHNYNSRSYNQYMTGDEFKNARKASAWTQAQAAARLGVTQAYLSMVERGERAVSSELASKAVGVFEVPATVLPLMEYQKRAHEAGFFQSMLGSLGYPGFAYLRSSARLNPVEVLMEALDSDDLDSRVTEALAWLPLAYPHLNWDWLTANAKLRDRQNRLGFVVELARQAAARGGSPQLEEELANHVAKLEPSRLVKEDTLCRESMTRAERAWLREHRPKSAEHWNLLTDLTVEQLDHVAL